MMRLLTSKLVNRNLLTSHFAGYCSSIGTSSWMANLKAISDFVNRKFARSKVRRPFGPYMSICFFCCTSWSSV